MDIKSKQFYTQGNKVKRPKTTLSLFGIFSTTPLNNSSAPKKYYSKSKKRKLNNTYSVNNVN